MRFVFHASITGSLDAYYQEVGRGGRDDDAAAAVLFYRPEDLSLQKFLAARKPQPDALDEVATALSERDDPVTPRELEADVDMSTAGQTRAANLLEQADAVRSTPRWSGGVRRRRRVHRRGRAAGGRGGGVTVLFDAGGYKTLALEAVERHGLLSEVTDS